jgi:hypothetical protein
MSFLGPRAGWAQMMADYKTKIPRQQLHRHVEPSTGDPPQAILKVCSFGGK